MASAAALAPTAARDGRGRDDGERLLSGWGRTAPTLATVTSPSEDGDLSGVLARAGNRGVLARGLGRSYGDAAQNAGGTVISTAGLSAVHELDLETDAVEAGAGASLAALTEVLVPRGRFLPVVPGTGQVTVGGAIACDVHGKSHHRDGAFGAHVERFDLVTGSGERLQVDRLRTPDVFDATAGGMGLTGVITRARLRLIRIETSRMVADTERARDLDDVMGRMESGDERYRYSVAWIDCLAPGRQLGRSVLIRGDHAPADALPAAERDDPLAAPGGGSLPAPPWAPRGLLRASTVRAFNEAWFRRAPREERGRLTGLREFFHPLDGVRSWNRLYGATGLLQYQLVVPFGAERAVRETLERLREARSPSFLAVIKRFGPGAGPLSFPMPGWTLALDLPAGRPELVPLLDGLDELVAGAGGRVYLAKDSRLRPDLLSRMYPRLDEWRAVRERLDPQGRLRSDLARRLELC